MLKNNLVENFLMPIFVSSVTRQEIVNKSIGD